MKKSFPSLIAITVLAIAILACSVTSPRTDNSQNNTQPNNAQPTSEIVIPSEGENPAAVPTESDIPHWDFALSKVLTHQEADDYLSKFESESFYKFEPQSGWHTVVAEIAVKGKDWVEVRDCPTFKIFVVDTGGFEREARFGIGLSECYAKTHLPPNGQMMITAFTEVPDNQEPAKIIIKYFDKNYEVVEAPEFNVSDASPAVFSTPYKIADWNTASNETTLEIPDTIRINFNFAGAYFVDGAPPQYGTYPNANHGTELFVPIKIENIGGQNISVDSSFSDFWNSIIQVDGIDSNGNVLTSTNIVAMQQLHSIRDSTIPPGQFGEYDLRLAYWSAPTTKLQWLWLGVKFSDGTSIVNTFQFTFDKPVAIGLFDLSYPADPDNMTWFNQPPPSQQP